jgi:hypothetical protein
VFFKVPIVKAFDDFGRDKVRESEPADDEEELRVWGNEAEELLTQAGKGQADHHQYG